MIFPKITDSYTYKHMDSKIIMKRSKLTLQTPTILKSWSSGATQPPMIDTPQPPSLFFYHHCNGFYFIFKFYLIILFFSFLWVYVFFFKVSVRSKICFAS